MKSFQGLSSHIEQNCRFDFGCFSELTLTSVETLGNQKKRSDSQGGADQLAIFAADHNSAGVLRAMPLV